MQRLDEIIKAKGVIIVNNDNKDLSNNDSNDNNGGRKSKYALDRTKFIPNTEEAQLAEKIAISMGDTENYACYFRVVKKLGSYEAERLLRSVLADIEEKADTKYPVRNKAKYFMWKYKYRRY